MAWVLKYLGGWQSQNTGGYVTILEQDYGGAMIPLTIRFDSISINYNFGGWEEPIIGLNAELSIVNDKDDFFDLIELMSAEEGQFRVLITQEWGVSTAQTLFDGFLACENTEQVFLQKQDIRLVCSSYLQKLEYLESTQVNTLDNETFINIILDCLELTGSTDPVYVNCHLVPDSMSYGTTKSLFNMCGIYTESFWENNVDKNDGLTILRKILTTFDCYLFWWGGVWYIERYADIWTDPQAYVKYEIGSTYGPDVTLRWTFEEGVAVSVNAPIITMNDFYIESDKTLGVIQGMREIEVSTNQQWMTNLTNSDFSNSNLTPCYTIQAHPALKSWMYWEPDGWYNYWITHGTNGQPFKNISNSIHRVSPVIDEEDIAKGLYTKFRVTVNPDTSLSISFKFATVQGGWIETDNPLSDWSRWRFDFYWFLRHESGPSIGYYIKYDEEEGTWTREYYATEDQYVCNVAEIVGTTFDPNDLTVTVNITIPLGAVEGVADSSGGTSTEEFVFGLGQERVVDLDGTWFTRSCYNAWYGDVSISATNELEDNVHKGTILTSFLNKLSIKLDIFDSAYVQMKNAIWRSNALDYLTINWDDGEEYLSIVEHKLRDKFRLYHKARFTLTAKLKLGTEPLFKPMSRFKETNLYNNSLAQQLVLAGYQFHPMTETLIGQFMEYDNTETINLE